MHRTNVWRWTLLASFCLAACAHADSSASSSTAPAASADAQGTEEQAAAGLREHHRHHHGGGIAHFIAMSLDTLGTDEAKRPQIEKIQADLRACTAPARDQEKALLATLADGVAAGKVDTAKVDADVAQVGSAAEGIHACAVSALNQLHAVLSPGERSALVDKVQAHYEVWRQVNHEAQPGGQEKGGRLAALAAELNLTPDQVSQISAALKATFGGPRASHFDPAKAEAHLKSFETAFVADTFDAAAVHGNANGHFATHGARRMSLFYETVAPLLTPEQRTALADHLRERANQPPSGAQS
jgi:Spy/CpxP family protein refolding chaperone